jgi:hypothetical protein
MRRVLFPVVAGALLVLVSLTSWAQQAPERELGVLLGAGFPSRELTGLPQTVERESVLLGVRGATTVYNGLRLFGDLTVTRYNEGADESLDVNEYAFRFGGEVPFGKRAQFFVSPAMGWARFDPAHDSSFGRGIASLGFGQRFGVRGSNVLHWELRVEHAFVGSGSGPQVFDNLQLLLGYAFGKPRLASESQAVLK